MASDDDDFDVLIDDDFDGIGADEEEGDTVTRAASPARTLSVRREIELRMEQRRMDRMLNYLELDFEDEE
ncbi:MAG: hypothetical protein JJT88_05665 [Gammaproteobacteria bacterium]|nr:hypothetical protein [Gammaproteobacteria bacterium]